MFVFRMLTANTISSSNRAVGNYVCNWRAKNIAQSLCSWN